MKQLKCTSVALALGIAFFMTLTSSLAEPGEQFQRALLNDPSITSLEIDGEIAGEGDFANLLTLIGTNTFINELILVDNTIRNDRALQLVEALRLNQQITSFTFTYNGIVTDTKSFIQSLVNNPRLIRLDLGGNKFGNEGLRALFQFLATNPALTQLDLGLNNLTIDGLAALVRALATNTTLVDLDLGVNRLGDDAVPILAALIQNNCTPLRRLGLAHNNLTATGVEILITALANNTTLTDLRLSNNNVGDTGIGLLVDMLLKNSVLQELILAADKITTQGALAVAKLLTNNRSITTLNLSYNDLGDDGVIAIAHALRSNTTLTTLNLTDTGIGDRAALAMIEALADNQTLTQLYLSNDNITDQTAMKLAEYLKSNHTLTKLYFVCYGITNQGVVALLQSLANNSVLEEVRIISKNIKITEDLIKALETALVPTTKITNLGITLDFRGEENRFVLERILLNALYNNHGTHRGLVIFWNTEEFDDINNMILRRNELQAELNDLQQRANGTTLFERRIGEINTTLTDLEQRLAEAIHNLNEQPEPSIFENQEVADQETEEEEEAETTAEEDRTNEPEINFATAHNVQPEDFILEFDVINDFTAAHNAQAAQPAAAAPNPPYNPFTYLLPPGLPPDPNSSSSFGSIF